MPGMALLMEGAMQHAPQPMRHGIRSFISSTKITGYGLLNQQLAAIHTHLAGEFVTARLVYG
jgi:hypothetical protein